MPLFGRKREPEGASGCANRDWIAETDPRFLPAGRWRITAPLLADPTSPLGHEQRELAQANLAQQLIAGEQTFRRQHLPEAFATIPARQLDVRFEAGKRGDATVATMVLTVQSSRFGAAQLAARIGHLSQVTWTQTVKDPSVADAFVALDFVQLSGPSLGQSGSQAFADDLIARCPRIAAGVEIGTLEGAPRIRLIDTKDAWEVPDISAAIAAADAIARRQSVQMACDRLFVPA